MANSELHQHSHMLRINSDGRGLVDITDRIASWLDETGLMEGLLTLFCRHTSASLIIQENASRAVQRDIEAFLATVAPEDPSRYEHDDEGPDDMPAHLRTLLAGVTLQIPLWDGQMRLGTWQSIYLFEHRRRPHRREIAMHVIGS